MSKDLYGLIGHPLSHSFSPDYFKEKFKRIKANAEYRAFDLDPIPSLNNLSSDYPELKGLNVTIPYKTDIIEQLNSIEGEAEKIGAVNVIQFKEGKFKGYNTDYIAFMQSVSPLIDAAHCKALILGTGGASKAIKHALRKWEIEYKVVSRSSDVGDFTYEDLSLEIMEEFNLIINTTPLGNFPEIQEFPPIPYEFLDGHHVLYDLTYNPDVTSFMQKGKSQGCTVKNGYDMLVRQAELSWEIWNS